MPKSNDKFRYSDWEWIVVHFPPAERKDMARTAWLIAQCSADEIAKHKNLDPRIVIPLCAIEFQDEINWEKLINFKKDKQYFIDDFIDYSEDSPSVSNWKYFQHQKQQQIVINKFVKTFINKISNSIYWKNLFSSLELKLQIDLLHKLSNSECRPERNHWRYVFQESKDYEFKKSWHYLLVRICTFLFLVFAILAMSREIYGQQNFWINGLIELALYILILFWVVPKQDPEHFIKFGLLGLLTFRRGLEQLLSNNLVKPNIDIFTINLNADIAAWAVARVVVLVVAVNVAGTLTLDWAWAWTLTLTCAGLGVGVGVGARTAARTAALAWAGLGVGIGARTAALAGALAFPIVVLAVVGVRAAAWAFLIGVLAVVGVMLGVVPVAVTRAFLIGARVFFIWALVFLIGFWALALALALVRVGFFLIGALVGIVGGALALALAFLIVAGALAGAGTGALALAGAGNGALVGILLTIGILAWYGRKNNQSYFLFLAIFTFPLFCWFPILVSFATIFLLRFFSWQHTLLIWLISLSTCTSLWLYGQDKDNKARNPLKGIL